MMMKAYFQWPIFRLCFRVFTCTISQNGMLGISFQPLTPIPRVSSYTTSLRTQQNLGTWCGGWILLGWSCPYLTICAQLVFGACDDMHWPFFIYICIISTNIKNRQTWTIIITQAGDHQKVAGPRNWSLSVKNISEIRLCKTIDLV